MTQQELSSSIYYPYDVRIKVNGDKALRGDGFYVAPNLATYDLKFRSYGSIHDFDLAVIETCHRFIKLEKQHSEFHYEYRPTALEKESYCPFKLTGFDEGAKVGFAFLDFETERMPIFHYLLCNGETVVGSKGVSVCQNKVGKLTRLVTYEPVLISPPEGCEIRKLNEAGSQYEIKHTDGFCVFVMSSTDGKKRSRVTTYGFEKLLIRGK